MQQCFQTLELTIQAAFDVFCELYAVCMHAYSPLVCIRLTFTSCRCYVRPIWNIFLDLADWSRISILMWVTLTSCRCYERFQSYLKPVWNLANALPHRNLIGCCSFLADQSKGCVNSPDWAMKCLDQSEWSLLEGVNVKKVKYYTICATELTFMMML